MAEPKTEEFLDDIDTAEAEELAEEFAEIDEAELELESLKAERDEFKDRFMRALADAENASAETKPGVMLSSMAGPSWPGICCRFMTI